MFLLCKSVLNFSPTCLYRSTKVLNAVSLTVAVGSESRLTMSGMNLFSVSDCVPCLQKKTKLIRIQDAKLVVPTLSIELRFSRANFSVKEILEALALLRLNHVYNLHIAILF